MKAVVMSAKGNADVLQCREITAPVLTTDTQVKVRLKAAGVNPVDTKLRSRGLYFDDALPAVLGCDGAGVVSEIGARVRRVKPGDEVWFCHGGLGREQGNYAEETVMEEHFVHHKPKSVDFIQAAAAPLVLLTAWEALYDRARLSPGQSVLVHAGAGGVGHVAIQLAKLRQCRVITTVGDAARADFVRRLGADEVVIYHERDFVEQVLQLTGNRGVDTALDTVGGATFVRTLDCMAHYSDVVTLLDPGTDVVWKAARNRNLRVGFELMLTPMLYGLTDAIGHQGDILDQCARWIDDGRLSVSVGHCFSLAQAVDAHRLIEEGHMQGKIVLVID